jgi:hypothetical protein
VYERAGTRLAAHTPWYQIGQGLDGKEACTKERSNEWHTVGEPEYGRQRAQGFAEYGLIIALVAVLAIAGLTFFGSAMTTLLSKLSGSV